MSVLDHNQRVNHEKRNASEIKCTRNEAWTHCNTSELDPAGILRAYMYTKTMFHFQKYSLQNYILLVSFIFCSSSSLCTPHPSNGCSLCVRLSQWIVNCELYGYCTYLYRHRSWNPWRICRRIILHFSCTQNVARVYVTPHRPVSRDHTAVTILVTLSRTTELYNTRCVFHRCRDLELPCLEYNRGVSRTPHRLHLLKLYGNGRTSFRGGRWTKRTGCSYSSCSTESFRERFGASKIVLP